MLLLDGVSNSSGRVKAAVSGLEARVGVAEAIVASAIRTPGAGEVCVCCVRCFKGVSNVIRPGNRPFLKDTSKSKNVVKVRDP